jgi:predicted RNase H-like nuclease (RuvC/YqgF family)
MANSTDTIEELQSAAKAFEAYVQEVENCIATMRKAAEDCKDNMGSDVYSYKAALRLEDCVTSLSSTVKEAQSTQEKIKKKISKIEDSANMI